MKFSTAWKAIQSIRGWFSNPDQARLMWEQCQDGRHAIEIGTYCGRSAILMALAMKAAGSTAKVYCVDTFQASNAELPDENTFDEFMTNVELAQVGDWIVPIRGSSSDLEIVARVPKEAGLLYIDGGHEYDQVLSDFRLWRMHVGKHGVLMVHDYYDDGQFQGVRRAVEDARKIGLVTGHMNRLAPDTVYFRRNGCGCGGWR